MLSGWVVFYGCAGAVVFLGLMVALSSLTSRGYSFASGRVQGVIGLMGSGKSLFIVTRVILPTAKALASKRGLRCGHIGRPVKRIITNFEMDLPYDVELIVLDGNRIFDHLFELAADLDLRFDAIVIIDEAYLFLTSAKRLFSAKAVYVCSMARKLNAEIWWLS